jgi:hypothetical protein
MPEERLQVGTMDPGYPQQIAAVPSMPEPFVAPTPDMPMPMPVAVPEPEPVVAPPEVAPGAPQPDASRIVVARVTRITGNVPVRRGSLCRFTVQRIDEPHGNLPYWCRAQVMCGDTQLYGGQTSGYFNCELEMPPSKHVRGNDENTTWSDSDAAFEIDTRGGRLVVRDDSHGFHGEMTVEARVVDVE